MIANTLVLGRKAFTLSIVTFLPLSDFFQSPTEKSWHIAQVTIQT